MYCSKIIKIWEVAVTIKAKTIKLIRDFTPALFGLFTMVSTILPIITDGKSPKTAETQSAANTNMKVFFLTNLL